MKNKTLLIKVLCALLALLLLSACGETVPGAVTPEPEVPAEPEAPAAPAEQGVVRVTNVDELLAAIAPDTTIELAAGDYVLYTASNYGRQNVSEYYEWTKEYDGPALTIHHVDNLVIRGEGADKVTLSAEPRYANVLSFVSCRNVTLEGITAGHTPAPGYCSGGVLRFEGCLDCTVKGCGLFGCGAVGIWAVDCAGLTVTDTAVYECSFNAYVLSFCRNVRIRGGEVYGCGRREGFGGALCLFDLSGCSSVVVSGVRVRDNTAERLLDSSLSRSVVLLSCEVRGNAFSYFFKLDKNGAVVDGCRFEGNSSSSWYADGYLRAADLTGRALDGADLAAMKLREIDPDVVAPVAEAEEAPVSAPGEEITVRNVDEFIAAIGPNRTIVLDGESFDLSAAADYGSSGGAFYYWEEVYDGFELVISGVKGLTIKAASDDPKAVTILAAPRYADVLSFRGCDELTLSGFTAGHAEAPGACGGGVLFFQDCRGVTLDSCRLYGCGTIGIDAYSCLDFSVLRNEIYDCSDYAVNMSEIRRAAFVDCNVHDVPDPAFVFYSCTDVSWNGELLSDEYYALAGGAPAPFEGWGVG